MNWYVSFATSFKKCWKVALLNSPKKPAIIGFDANEGIFLAPYVATGSNQTIADEISYSYFWCPATKTTYERLAANRTTHRFFYAGNFTNISPKPWMGAYHGSELPLLFGTHNLNGNSTAFEDAVSQTMQDAYVAFASDPENGLTEANVEWPAYEGMGGQVRAYAEDGVVTQMRPLTDIEDKCAVLGLA